MSTSPGLNLFTNENLRILNCDGNFLTLKKMNVTGTQSKQAKILDTDKFEKKQDKISNFKAIKLVDIRFRKDYLGEPFDFNMQYYNKEIKKTISELKDARIASLESTVNKLSNST